MRVIGFKPSYPRLILKPNEKIIPVSESIDVISAGPIIPTDGYWNEEDKKSEPHKSIK